MNLKDVYNELRKKKYTIRRVWREIWPINFKRLNSSSLSKSIPLLPYSFKVVLIVMVVIFISSTFLTLFATYLQFTKIVPTNNSIVREATLENIDNFNPVLDGQTDTEQKISRLLFHPLYEVTYPDYYFTEDPQVQIKPILLSQAPEYTDVNNPDPTSRYKNLKMVLKENIFWSNGEKITTEDVNYSFRRLQEDGGNTYFKGLFAGLSLEVVSDTEFNLVSPNSNPRLIYLSNFSPVSKNYFEAQVNSRLIQDTKSKRPEVTSGYYVFSQDTTIPDPYNKKKNITNPLNINGKNSIVVLDRNPISNISDNPHVEKYVVKKYERIDDVGGVDTNSMEYDSTDSLVDMFTRNASFENSPAFTKDKLLLEQQVLNTNNFYNVYLNTQQSDGEGAYTGYLINQSLRKYIACHLINYQYNGNEFFENIPKERKLLPLHFAEEYKAECPEDLDTVLDKDRYTVTKDERSGVKRVYLNGLTSELKLNFIAYKNYNNLAENIQNYFLNTVGIPLELYNEESVVNSRLQKKDYHIALLPMVLLDKDPYSTYGRLGNNLSVINGNPRIKDYDTEGNLKRYSESSLTDEGSRNNLISFFKKEYVSVNLLRVKSEINYSNKLYGKNSNQSFNSNLTQVYSDLPFWYKDTQRVFKY